MWIENSFSVLQVKYHTIFTINIRTPLLFTILVLMFEQLQFTTWMCGKSVDADQTARSTVSNLGLHCLHRHVYPNTKGKYGITII